MERFLVHDAGHVYEQLVVHGFLSANALLICAAVVVDFCATMSASECTKRNVDRCVKWSKLLCIWPITRHLEILPKILFQLQLTGGRRDSSRQDRKSTRLNSSHVRISYAVF